MSTLKSKLLPGIMVMSILSFSAIAFVPAAVAAPATYTVNVTGDEGDANVGDGICETANVGECTLRAAIEEANANSGADTIEFNIAQSGVQTITLESSLPDITETLTIDGYSEAGSSVNTSVSPAPINSVITIGIDSGPANTAISIKSDDVAIKGLSIYNCRRSCVKSDSANTQIYGNYIGIDPTGLSIGSTTSEAGLDLYNDTNIGARIGSVNAADRNIIVGAQSLLIHDGVSGADIYGNYVGIGKDGITDFNIFQNIMMLFTSGDHIGGSQVGQGNLVSGSQSNITGVFSSDVSIKGNYVGSDYTGHANLNIENGVGIALEIFSTDIIVGGPNVGDGNIIVGNGGVGVAVVTGDSSAYGGFASADKISILGNSIYDISLFDYPGFGNSNQGIDLFGLNADDEGQPTDFYNQGVTKNDSDVNGVRVPGDLDEGSNGYINFPELLDAQQVGDQLTVHLDLDAADSPSDTYRVEFFTNDHSTIFGYGPGQTYLGSVSVANGTNNEAVLTLPDGLDVSGKSLSATTTAIDNTSSSGFGSTSEFARNILVGSASDFDSDTVPDVVENAGPNNGDGNNDGILDSTQPTVTTFVSATSGTYTTFVTSGCSSNGLVTSIAESTLGVTDGAYSYPYGLTDFSLNCSRGDIVTIDKYIFTNDNDVSDSTVRKYRPNTHVFESVPESSVNAESIGGLKAIHLNYSIEDGGALDDDATANGIIVDPFGLAKVVTASQTVDSPTTSVLTTVPSGSAQGTDSTKSASGTLSSTGANSSSLFNIALATLMSGFAIFVLTRRKFAFRTKN